MKRCAPALFLLAACASPPPPEPRDPPPTKHRDGRNSSGGPLLPEQAAFDVLSVELDLRVDPERKSIAGSCATTFRALERLGHLLLDLDDRLEVSAVDRDGRPLAFRRAGGLLAITLDRWLAPGDDARVRVAYAGEPVVAPNPPWEGGFTWAKTPDGRPWIATTCQMNGADLWWPCKDHPSDKPGRADLRVTVPEGLVVASNGVLVSEAAGGDGTRTFHWRVSSPISNYCIALNIAPYERIEREVRSVTGETMRAVFYVLPQSRDKARAAFDGFLDHVRVFEEVCGPFPFRAEKYGVVETPHLGMEHQTILAYGNAFRADRRGYDWLHNHELSHEWWGNLVTCRDWKDMWIHEGIGTYMQAVYLERRFGKDAYRREMASKRSFANTKPVAPRESCTSREIYGGDIYAKGAWVMHSLRWVLGDELFWRVLRRLAYPDPAKERATDGSQVRLSDTDEILAIAERESGRSLGWFFEVYLRRSALPRLAAEQVGDELRLEWAAPDGLAFPMPVPVEIGGETRRVEMRGGKATVTLGGKTWKLDPEAWVTRGD